MKNKRPIISVGIITYNQEQTICQTLDGIVCQQGDFDLEVVIGEDHGTDGTRAICEEYAVRYPSIVRLLPDEPNMGIMRNFARVMKACSGDYIAMCAGDDYWCDEHKLQKQLDYFNAHPEVGVVSTSGYRLLVRRNKLIPNAIAPIRPLADGNVRSFYFSPSYPGGVYAMPLSLLIRKEALEKVNFNEFIRRDFPVEDYPMQAVLSQYCKWGHINDLTVVYRVYKESATFISFNSPKYLSYHKGLMDIRRYLNELFPANACFSEEWMQDYEFYKEYLLYLHKWQYRKAKALLAHAAQTKAVGQPHYQQAQRMTRNWFRFVAFAIYKEFTYHKDIKNRT